MNLLKGNDDEENLLDIQFSRENSTPQHRGEHRQRNPKFSSRQFQDSTQEKLPFAQIIKNNRELEVIKNENKRLSQKKMKYKHEIKVLKQELSTKNEDLERKLFELSSKEKAIKEFLLTVKTYETKMNEKMRTIERVENELSNYQKLYREEKIKSQNQREEFLCERSEMEKKILKLQENFEVHLKGKTNRLENKEICESSINPFGEIQMGASNIQNLTFTAPFHQNESNFLNQDNPDSVKFGNSFIVEMKDPRAFEVDRFCLLENIFKNHRNLWRAYCNLLEKHEMTVRQNEICVYKLKSFIIQRSKDYENVLANHKNIRSDITSTAQKIENMILGQKLTDLNPEHESNDSSLNSIICESPKSKKQKTPDTKHVKVDEPFDYPQVKLNAEQNIHMSDKHLPNARFFDNIDITQNQNRFSLEFENQRTFNAQSKDFFEIIQNKPFLTQKTTNLPVLEKKQENRKLEFAFSKDFNNSDQMPIQDGVHCTEDSQDECIVINDDECSDFRSVIKKFMEKTRNRLKKGKKLVKSQGRLFQSIFEHLNRLSSAVRNSKIELIDIEKGNFLMKHFLNDKVGVEKWEENFKTLLIELQNSIKRIEITAIFKHLKFALEQPLGNGYFSTQIEKEIRHCFSFIDSKIGNNSDIELVYSKIKFLDEKLGNLIKQSTVKESLSPIRKMRSSLSKKNETESNLNLKFSVLYKMTERLHLAHFSEYQIDNEEFSNIAKQVISQMEKFDEEHRKDLEKFMNENYHEKIEMDNNNLQKLQFISSKQLSKKERITSMITRSVLSVVMNYIRRVK